MQLAGHIMNQDLGGWCARLFLIVFTTVVSGQFYGRSLPCPTSYLDPDGDCVAGIAGKDYPLHSTFPKTSFKCSDHPVKLLGYFADPASGCQVFHVCLHDGRQESFMCPNGTLFNQQFLVCDWWFNVKCSEANMLYQINEYLQTPINFRHGPLHPNVIPIPSDSNMTPNRKSDNFQHIEEYDVMPRRPANKPEGIATTATTTTTETPVTPSSIEWSMFGLREREQEFGVAPTVRNSTLPAGLPRMLRL